MTMREVHIRKLDLNLLHPLQALLEERHVSRAAKRCFLSQPAMSRALQRLREMFADPLIVRSKGLYERTARGERLLQEVQALVLRIESVVRGEQFDPIESRERFRFAMTDHASMIVLPALLRQIRMRAPSVCVESSAWSNRSYDEVTTGRLDIALSAEAAPPTLETQVLFRLDFVCLVGSKNPMRSRRLTLKQYLQLPHALVETWGGQQTLVDRPLAQLALKRRVVLSIPFFVPAIFAIADTDMIVTVPKRLAKMTAGIAGVRSVEPPREIEAFPYFMTWHPRVTHEPGHAWLRQLLRDVTMAA